MPTRPGLTHDNSSESTAFAPSPIKSGPLNGVSVHLIQTKIPPDQVAALLFELEQLGATIVTEPLRADVIVTAITMRQRLDRHIPTAQALHRDVVSPKWVEECAKSGTRVSGQQYPAIREPKLRLGPRQRLDNSHLSDQEPGTPSTVGTDSPFPSPSSVSTWDGKTLASPAGQSTQVFASRATNTHSEVRGTVVRPGVFPLVRPPMGGMSPLYPNPAELPPSSLLVHDKFPPTANLAVHRLHPLVCPNQGLVAELAIIRRQRELEREDRSALSYARAIAAIKAQPARFDFNTDVRAVPYVGAKISDKIEEYLELGYIQEAAGYRRSERFNALNALTTIHGIGGAKARELYDRGIRGLEECDRFYGVTVPDGYGNWIPNENMADLDDEESGSGQQDSIIREALALREDLNQKISRDEVELIATTIGQELEKIEPGCMWEICGGYRRGKLGSNDVDIVLTHPEGRRVMGLCTRLVEQLKRAGMVTRSWSHLKSYHRAKPSETPRLPNLDKSLLVFRLPSSTITTTARRVDLIFANPDSFWVAVVGWTGSIMFQRDVRVWAAKQGFKFNDSGIMRVRDSQLIPIHSEQEVFEVLGLPFVEPRWRNADL